ncbi:MAG: type II toxin-antitoxin system prevent-host-death family antitoxin [Actinomycetes bacterium]|jgi:antitoxin (DNA-binding transcriptional repressor) of toxin-antitoxin stability system|nr:type II toxin-antitoxin system prevent-host-death family antitoxin [Actinomycetes bacterium]
MTITMNVQDAKTNLSRLLASLGRGDKVIIAKRGVPYARLELIEKPAKRELGFLKDLDLPPLPDSFFDPLPEDELALWE